MNISEGRDDHVIGAVAAAGGDLVLDVHSDPDHNRTVLTLAGEGIEDVVSAVARHTVDLIDLRTHRGVHPRFGALDVVPFTPLDADGSPLLATGDLVAAVGARDRFATWAGRNLGLPCFVYGPDGRLPDIRRHAFASLAPDAGPSTPHPTAGACAVGARFALVAYNLWLATGDLEVARSIAASVRGPDVRALGLRTGALTQVSCNLVNPMSTGPEQIYDAVDALAHRAATAVSRTELVGLVPAAVVEATTEGRRRQLDVDLGRTFEARLERSRARRR